MKLKYIVLLLLVIILSCSKKHHPQTTSAVNKPVAKKNIPIPNVVDVPDKIAMKDMDGKLYYDMNGHRYWKNYADGRYYLFNKSMYNNPAFKPH